MKFVKCKNETEKLQAVMSYCNEKIQEYKGRIEWFEANKVSSLDYMEEIDELKTRIAVLEQVTKIIEADEHTSVMVF